MAWLRLLKAPALFNRSLMARLVGYYLLLSLLTVSLVGFIAYGQARQHLEQSVYERLNALISFKEGELDRWIEDQKQDVVLLARSPDLLTSTQPLLSQSESNPEVRAAYDRLLSNLQSILKARADWREISILSSKGGEILLSTNKDFEGQYRVTDSFFVQGKAGTFVQNVYPSPITAKPTMTISTPVVDLRSNETTGVLAVNLNLDRMDAIIQDRTGLGDTGETYLVDQFNVFVSGDRFGREEFPRGVHTVGVNAALQQQDGAGSYPNYANVPVVGVYHWLDKNELALMGEISQQEAFAPARNLALAILSVGLVSAGALAITVYWLARQIARPILTLSQAATQVASGDLSSTAPVMTQDEVGVLAKSFNRMTNQLRISRQELESYNRTLEEKVSQRTLQLAQANEEILELNNRLKAENVRLSAELDITRQLQQMTLPRQEELKRIHHLDIDGLMEPAEEVGGDYYDVLLEQGRIKIGIGDVTGHGLESGVLMLMVQTAVRALLQTDNLTLPKLITQVNRTIYQNVKRMGSDRTLSLAILDYQDGHLSISGQHEEVLIVRQGGQIERIDTINLGFPVGLEPDIAQFVDEIQVYLQPGDGVVLYTDGVIEAQNAAREQYGVERLSTLVGQHWQRAAQDIRQIVIDDVRRHISNQRLRDDITLVVFKRQ